MTKLNYNPARLSCLVLDYNESMIMERSIWYFVFSIYSLESPLWLVLLRLSGTGLRACVYYYSPTLSAIHPGESRDPEITKLNYSPA
jgi:hypothetical protein